MWKIFLMSFKLRIAYVMNNIIYSFKQIPLIGKEISDDCYSSKGFKVLGGIFAFLKEIIWNMLIKKLVYFIIMFLVIPGFILSLSEDVLELGNFDDGFIFFTLPFLAFTLIGGFIHNEMFSTEKDKYYAIFTMRIDTKKYVISNYLYYLIKTMIAYIPFVLAFGAMENMLSVKARLLLPIIMALIKIICSNLRIQYFKRTKKVKFKMIFQILRNYDCNIWNSIFIFCPCI